MVLRSVWVDPDEDGIRRSIKQNPFIRENRDKFKMLQLEEKLEVSRRTGSPGEQGQTRNSPKVNRVTGANTVIHDYIRVTRANGNPGT